MAHPDYEEFLAALNARSVRYLVGGAHALALHARPRATKDFDVFIDPSAANAQRAVLAIADFFDGTAPQYVTAETLQDPDVIVQLGVAPVRIDLLCHFGAIRRFDDAWKRRVDADFGGTAAHYLSLEDLIREKRHSSRAQDVADLVALESVLQCRPDE